MSDGLSMKEAAECTFEPWTKDALDELPNREEMRDYADGVGTYLRMCVVLMLDDDEQLAAKIKTDEDADTFVEFVEGVATKINGLEGFVEAMREAVARVSVAVARYELQNQAVTSLLSVSLYGRLVVLLPTSR